MTSLDRDIHEALDVISLLLVFVFGYFAAFFPQADETIEAPVLAGASIAERKQQVRRLRRFRHLVTATTLLAAASLLFVSPLMVRLIADWSWEYSITRIGLLLIVSMLAVLLAVNLWLIRRLTDRIDDLAS